MSCKRKFNKAKGAIRAMTAGEMLPYLRTYNSPFEIVRNLPNLDAGRGESNETEPLAADSDWWITAAVPRLGS